MNNAFNILSFFVVVAGFIAAADAFTDGIFIKFLNNIWFDVLKNFIITELFLGFTLLSFFLFALLLIAVVIFSVEGQIADVPHPVIYYVFGMGSIYTSIIIFLSALSLKRYFQRVWRQTKIENNK